MHLVIDTSADLKKKAYDFEFYIHESLSEKYNKVRLKSIYVQHGVDISKLFAFTISKATCYKPICIHCNLLTKDDNWVNKEKFDVIAILYPDLKAQKHLYVKLPTNWFKILPSCNHLRIHLTDMANLLVEHQINYYIIYEFEFS